MRLQVVSIFDSAMNEYITPFFVPAVGMAVRSFSDEVLKESSPMYAHPEDFELFHLGEFDSDVGVLASLPDPVRLARALDYKPVRS